MTDHDVAVVGGGPAGASAAIYTARYGLDTVVFDRGRSSLAQCAFLENYPGFPAGVPVETFQELLCDHLETAGATLEEDLVERVTRVEHAETSDESAEAASSGDRPGEDAPLRVEPQAGEPRTADRVVAATRYDADYLRSLCGPEAFETLEYDGESHERFDRDYADADGSTPIEGLFVASPSAAADRQAIVAAGRGARVGLAVVEAVRADRGIPTDFGRYRDWVRSEADRSPEWGDRDRWREWFDERLPEDHDLGSDEVETVREREVDRLLDTYRADETVAADARAGQRRLLEHLDDDLVRERASEIEANRSAVPDGGEGD